MSRNWKKCMTGVWLLGLTLIALSVAGCGGDHNNNFFFFPSTTKTGTITAAAGTGVAAGTTVKGPSGVTSMTFINASVLSDGSTPPVPVVGTITTRVTRSTSTSRLPAAAPTGNSLAVLLDIVMTQGTTTVKTLSTPLTVVVSVPSGVTSVDIYSYDTVAARWVPERAGVTAVGGKVTFDVTHLSVWALFTSNTTGFRVTTTSPITAGTVGTVYSGQTLAATGGTGALTWSLAPGSNLPAGLTLDPTTGAISGTPTTAGTSTFAVNVSDSTTPTAQTATRAFTITVNSVGSGFTITTPSSLPAGTVGTSYPNQTLAATGGTGALTWSLAPGSTLPAGLTLDPTTGVISGTPTTAGTSTFTINVSDSATPTANTASQPFTMTVNSSSFTITTTSPLTAGTVGTAYNQTLVATGGTGTLTWSLAPGSTLPAGLTLEPATGVISGTPTTAGNSTFTINVSDSTSPTAQIASQTFTLPVSSAGFAITTTSPLPTGAVGTAYPDQTLAATGGTGALTWSLAPGSTLPAGLTLNPTTGVISGTATTAGTSTFTVNVSDSTIPTAQTASQTFTITFV